jgi:sodium/proline symporter
LYRQLLRPEASALELLRVGRAAVLGIALLAGWIALDPSSKVLDLVAWAWAGFGAAFGPAILLSLHWRGMTRGGAIAGILTGGATVILWQQGAALGGVFSLYELVPGFVLSTLAILLVSRLTR